jgi:hypothetical protein
MSLGAVLLSGELREMELESDADEMARKDSSYEKKTSCVI